MENQHRKITGYRELSAEEIVLMNRIKAKGAELLSIQEELRAHLIKTQGDLGAAVEFALTSDAQASARAEFERFLVAEPHRWASIGKTDIQTGIMALVRAVAQPAV